MINNINKKTPLMFATNIKSAFINTNLSINKNSISNNTNKNNIYIL